MSLSAAAPTDLARRLLASRGADREAAQWVAAGLAAWLRAEGVRPLQYFLGLPRTARKTQQWLRDLWLAEAAKHIEARTEWQRATKLAEEIRRFEGQLWPCWRGQRLPPPRARPVEQALFFARQHGELPKTSRQLRNILVR
jgi:hypothetical protein